MIQIAPLEFLRWPLPQRLPQHHIGQPILGPRATAIRAILNAAIQTRAKAINLHPDTWEWLQKPDNPNNDIAQALKDGLRDGMA